MDVKVQRKRLKLFEAAKSWLAESLDTFGAGCCEELDLEGCQSTSELDTAPILIDALSFTEQLLDLVRQLLAESNADKAQIVDSQAKVIDLQDQLLTRKDEYIKSVQTTVKTSMSESVKAELISYSEAVRKDLAPSPVIAPETIKSVVQTVVEEEDRSRSLIIFGLPEVENEEEEPLHDAVVGVFEQLGEKPRLDARRLRTKRDSNNRPRPVKVTVCNPSIARNILAKTKVLRKTEQYKNVFVTPDRTPEQQEEHRELVKELKRRTTEQPSHRHYISGGKLHSVMRGEGQ